MTAFHEIQFPPDISQGAVGGPRFNTSVLTLSSGAEHRNINWAKQRGEWDVAHGVKTQEQVNVLLAFFYARRGKAYGFRFKDWSDYRCPRWRTTPGDIDPLPTLFTTDTGTTTFQLSKPYGDSAAQFVRAISKPVVGTINLLLNGSPLSDYTIDVTGLVTLGLTTAGINGGVITGHFEFDVPCRFDTDDMKLTTVTTENFAWSPVPIVETRELV